MLLPPYIELQKKVNVIALCIFMEMYSVQPCKIYMKPEDLQFMFSEMVQRSEQLFFTPVESMDERLFHLPLFLEALASIVKEVDEVNYIQACTLLQ